MSYRDLTNADLAARASAAERAFARVSAESRAEVHSAGRRHGCERDCPDCTIKCAVVAGALADFRAEISRRERRVGRILAHAGREFHVMAGSA